MSFLYVGSSVLGESFRLNVISFNTFLFSEMASVQTKKMQQHFPTKAQQPEVTFNLMFRGEPQYERFQKFVRHHQLAALNSWPQPEVTLWWPERDITDWTGIIKDFKAGGMRRNYTPQAKLTVDLVDSAFYHRTELASAAPSIWQVAGYGSPSGMLNLPSILGQILGAIGRGGGIGGGF